MDVSNLLDQIPGQYLVIGVLLFWFLSVIVFQHMTSISKKVLSDGAQEKFQQFWVKNHWTVAYIFVLLNIIALAGVNDPIVFIAIIIMALHTIFRWAGPGSEEGASENVRSAVFGALVAAFICSLGLYFSYSNQADRNDDVWSRLFQGQIKCDELRQSGEIVYLDGEMTTLEYLCLTISDALDRS